MHWPAPFFLPARFQHNLSRSLNILILLCTHSWYLLLYFFQTTVITTLHQGRYNSSFMYSTPLAHLFFCTLNSCAACHDILHSEKCTACIPLSCWTHHVCRHTFQIFWVQFLFLDTSLNVFPLCPFSNTLQVLETLKLKFCPCELNTWINVLYLKINWAKSRDSVANKVPCLSMKLV